VFALVGCLGVVNAFDIPARQPFVLDMLGREDLCNAMRPTPRWSPRASSGRPSPACWSAAVGEA
jgi:hypothetical protein